ncbi:Calx-beta domain-containing protein [Falsiroseomonas sp. CW058]|uniref:Calx-beta domain-containing protein n=1 Tax=Falsiroseomonas sp. CW058 TaxID=3388664 RepID=UPI003D321229
MTIAISTNAAGQADGTVVRVPTLNGGVAGGGMNGISFSPDGTRVLFSNVSGTLVEGDTNGTWDVFVWNLVSNVVTRVSTAADGGQGNGESYDAAFSADGGKVVFSSRATNLVGSDVSPWNDIFMKDLATGAVTRLSTTATGGEANGNSYAPSLSADGRLLLFRSDASNLVAGDTNNTADVFVKNLATGVVTRVSATATGVGANGYLGDAVLSPDGTRVAFASSATNLGGPGDGRYQVYVKTLATGAVQLVSTSAAGQVGDSDAIGDIAFSPDGRLLAFSSSATNLVAGDTNLQSDLFIKNLATGAVTRVSTGAGGQQASGASYNPAFSADGGSILFLSTAPDLVAGDTNGQSDLFIKNLATGAITRVSTAGGGGEATGSMGRAALSPDGRLVAFDSTASNLVPNAPAAFTLYAKSLVEGTSALTLSGPAAPVEEGNAGTTPAVFTITRSGDLSGPVSVAWGVTSAGNLGVQASDFAGGVLPGGTVSFAAGQSSASFTVDIAGDLLAGPDEAFNVTIASLSLSTHLDVASVTATIRNDDQPVVPGGALRLVSSSAAGVAGDAWSVAPVFSPDGTRIAFQSSSTNLVPGDTNNALDVFIKDLATGIVTRVSTDAAGRAGMHGGSAPAFSPDGTRIAFLSASPDLVAGDTNTSTDAFVKDLTTGAITRVSTTASGGQVVGDTQSIVFSPTGDRVAFASFAPGLVAGDTVGGTTDIFVKHLGTGAVTLVTANAAGQAVGGWTERVAFSPDGGKIAFVTGAALVAADTNAWHDVYVRDLATGAVTLVSASATGQVGNQWSPGEMSFSPDGTLVAFSSDASNLVAGDTNGVPDIFVKNLATGAITRVSTDAAGGQVNSSSASPVFSPDGTRIAFTSGAGNLVARDTNGNWDVFVKDLATGAVTLVSRSSEEQTPAGGVNGRLSFSPDGTSLAFVSIAANLVPGVTAATGQVYVATLAPLQGGLYIAGPAAPVEEGQSGATPVTFTVTRTGDAGAAASVAWNVTGAGATASDFAGGVLPGGTVSFAAGQSSATITVEVAGDRDLEGDEGFAVALSAPSGAVLGVARALATIRNDDALLTLAGGGSVAEGSAGTTPVTFTVTRTGDLRGTAGASWGVTGGTATAEDFAGGVLPGGTVSFATGQASATITVTLAADTALEADEAFTVTLSDATGAVAAPAGATATIRNDDAGLSIAGPAAPVAEGSSGSAAATFTVTRTGDLSRAGSVGWSVAGSSPDAANAADFTGGTLPAGTVSFVAGQASATITVNIAGDTAVEADEAFAVTLSNPVGATLLAAAASATIRNDDAGLSIAGPAAPVAEGNAGTTPVAFTVTRAGDTSGTATARWTVTGTGAAAADFAGGVLPTGTVSFAAGQASATITVNLAADTALEADEAFTVTLSSPVGAVISTATATATIRNDDATLSIAGPGASVAEGQAGTTPVTFTVTRTGDTGGAASANWAVTGSGTAVANAADFAGGVLPSGAVVFAPGQSSATITLDIAGDTEVEPNEGFTVTLSGAAGATLAMASATTSIRNDDAAFTVTGPASPVTEGNAGSTAASFTVTRSGDTSAAGTVAWSVAGSGANPASDADFAGGALPAGTLAFAAGQTSATITLGLAGDTTFEPDEGFTLSVTGPGGTTSAAATIRNDDAFLSIADVAAGVVEGHSGTKAVAFTVTRGGNTAGTASAAWAVTGSGANAADFAGGVLPTGTVSFAAGQASATITVNIAGDSALEPDETFAVTLSNPVGASLGTATGTATIRNDDATLSIAGPALPVAEGNSGSTPATFTVTRAGDVSATASAAWAVTGSGATAADFAGGVLPAGTVSFVAGQASATITVNIAGDVTPEGDEGFTVTLSNPSTGVTLATAAASGTIRNDDASFTVAGPAAPVAEGNSGTTPVTFTITRGGDLSAPVTATWTVGGGVDAADFAGGVLPGGTVAFAAGQSSATVTVEVAGDTVTEGDEAFSFSVAGGGAAASAGATIRNDDATLSLAGPAAPVAEGQSGSTPVTFTVTRTGDTSGAASAAWAVTGQGAGAADFAGGVLPGGTVAFAAGQASATITVELAADAVLEPDEGFTVTLSDPAGATLGTASAAATIRNDDAVLSIASPAAPVTEGNTGSTPVTFTVTRGGDLSGAASAAWAVTGGGATAADFTGGVLPAGTVSFAAGQGSATITVNVAGNTVAEPDEAFTVTLSDPSPGIAFGMASAAATIRNDDAGLFVTGPAGPVEEGDAGATPVTFTVTRAGDISTAFAASWRLSYEGTFPLVQPDLAPITGRLSGTISLAAGQAATTVTVEVAGDPFHEPDEGFILEVRNSAGTATLARSDIVVIRNDDAETPPGDLLRVSTAADGAQADGASAAPSFSPDGRRVLFQSDATNLVPGDFNRRTDIFLKDLDTGAVTRVSTSATGEGGNELSIYPVFSPDGGRVAFASAASNLVAGDNGVVDVFVKDLATGAVTLVSREVTPDGMRGSSGLSSPSFSGDGRLLAFASESENLIIGDTNARADIFLARLDTGVVTRVSTTGAGAQANGASFHPVLSPDGTRIAFASSATNLVAGDTNGSVDFFVKDLVTGVVTRVSTTATGAQANGNIAGNGTARSAFSPDGTKLAFEGSFTNLVPGDTNGIHDIFVKDLLSGAVTRVSTTAAGGQANSASYGPVFSPDGGKLAFLSWATNLVEGDTNAKVDVFVKDLATGAVTRASATADGLQGDDLALDFPSGGIAFSPDGLRIAFTGRAGNLTPGDTNGVGDILLRDLALPPASLSIAGPAAPVEEGDAGWTDVTFTVTRAGPAAEAAWAEWSVAAGSAAGAADFAGGALPAGTVTFAAGQTSATVTVTIAGDTDVEPDETFALVLSNPTANLTIGNGTAAATIRNDDAALSISGPALPVREGTGGDTPVAFTVTRTGDASGTASVAFAVTGGGAAGAGAADFPGGALPSGTVEFAAGQTTATITITFAGDALREADEAFAVTLSDAAGASIAIALATVTILDDDTPPTGPTSGADTLPGTPGPDMVDGLAGRDRLSGGAGADTLLGGLDHDTLLGEDGADSLDGGAGADSLVGGAGDDAYAFGLGDAILEAVGGGADTVFASVSILLAPNIETLVLTGADSIGGTGNTLGNLIIGNDAPNALVGNGGADTLVGGAGNDSYRVDNLDRIVELEGGGQDTVVALTNFSIETMDHVEVLQLAGTEMTNGIGNARDNLVIGNTLANRLHGLAGDDTLSGGAGDDWLRAGDGNDSLVGGAGLDRLDGGAGNDTYSLADADTIVEGLDGGTDLVVSLVTAVLGANVENLSLTGGSAIDGTGNGLANVLIGNALANRLDGAGGADSIAGGNGADTLVGGAGADTLAGGPSDDIFLLRNAAEGGDLLTDYVARFEQLAVSAAGFGGGLAPGMDLNTPGRFVANLTGLAMGPAGTGQFIYETDALTLWWDADGTGALAAQRLVVFAAAVAGFNGAEISVIA